MFIHDIIKIKYIEEGYLPNYPYHLISDAEMFDAFLEYSVKIEKDDALDAIIDDAVLWSNPIICLDKYKLSSYSVNTASKPNYVTYVGSLENVSELVSDLDLDVKIEPFKDCYFCTNFPLISDKLSEEYTTLVNYIQQCLDRYKLDETDVLPDWVYGYMLNHVISVNSNEADIHDLSLLMYADDEENSQFEFTSSMSEECFRISSEWVKKLPAKYDKRPPTMFGEPHVVKSLRLNMVEEL